MMAVVNLMILKLFHEKLRVNGSLCSVGFTKSQGRGGARILNKEIGRLFS